MYTWSKGAWTQVFNTYLVVFDGEKYESLGIRLEDRLIFVTVNSDRFRGLVDSLAGEHLFDLGLLLPLRLLRGGLELLGVLDLKRLWKHCGGYLGRSSKGRDIGILSLEHIVFGLLGVCSLCLDWKKGKDAGLCSAAAAFFIEEQNGWCRLSTHRVASPPAPPPAPPGQWFVHPRDSLIHTVKVIGLPLPLPCPLKLWASKNVNEQRKPFNLSTCQHP